MREAMLCLSGIGGWTCDVVRCTRQWLAVRSIRRDEKWFDWNSRHRRYWIGCLVGWLLAIGWELTYLQKDTSHKVGKPYIPLSNTTNINS